MIRIFRNDRWPSTRGIWNQYGYHVTNVNNDGSIPRFEARSWEAHYGVPMNPVLQPVGAIDLSASRMRVDATACPDSVRIIVRAGNGGVRPVSAEIKMALFDGNPSAGARPLAIVPIGTALASGEYTDMSFTLRPAPRGLRAVYASIDNDGAGNGVITESDEVNNTCGMMLNVCNAGPTFTSTPITTVGSDAVYAYAAKASDPDGDTVRYSLRTSPQGMLIDYLPSLWAQARTLRGCRSRGTTAYGNAKSHETIVEASGQMKLGAFALAFDDLRVPLTGMDLAIGRMYDSRLKTLGDFRYGWGMTLTSMKLTESGVQGRGWSIALADPRGRSAPWISRNSSILRPCGCCSS